MADQDSRSGVTYADPDVLSWLEKVHAPHDEGLERAFAAPSREGLPAIQVGVSEGKALGVFLSLISAEKVVEVGTLAGYSALWMARAVAPSGRIYSIENDPRHAEVARANLAKAGVGDRVEIHVGDALDILPTLEPRGPFDAVFVDADKGNYDAYGRWAAKNLRKGGLLLGDNAFYFGKLLEESESASSMRRFHEEAAASFDTVCLPTPDGLLIGVRR